MFSNKPKNFNKNIPKKEPKPYDAQRLLQYSIWLLSRRDYTQFEMNNKLLSKQPDSAIVQSVLDKLLDYKYIDDERRANSIFNSYNKKESPNKTKRRLFLKGVDSELVDKIISENVTDEQQISNAFNLLNKKFKTYDHEKSQKYYQFLASKGFSWDLISKALSQFKQGDLSEDSF
jgi:regulatory protein